METWKVKKNSVILVHPRKDDKPHQLSNWVSKLTIKEVIYTDAERVKNATDWDWLEFWRLFELPDASQFDLIAIPICSLTYTSSPTIIVPKKYTIPIQDTTPWREKEKNEWINHYKKGYWKSDIDIKRAWDDIKEVNYGWDGIK